MTADEPELQPLDSAPHDRRPPWMIVTAVVIVVGVIAVIAILASRDDSGDGTASDPAAGSTDDEVAADEPGDGLDGSAASVGETRPVVIAGEPLPALEDGAADAAIGATAPVIEGEEFDGSAVTIGGATGSPTMIVYVAHWCPHCNDEIPELIALADAGALPADLDVIAVSTAVREGEANYPPSQWLADFGWPWPVLVDDPDATAFLVSGGSTFPYTVLLDADGTVLDRSSGARSADEISAWIDETLG